MGTMLGQWIIIAIILGWTDTASATCGPGCFSCQGNTDICTECRENYYLDGKTCVPCPDRCRKCLFDNTCILCDGPYFGSYYPHCNKTCPNNCNSSGCDALNGYCFGCQQGFYGSTCEQKCDLCTDNRCDRFACSEGCKMGYYEIVSSATYSYCLPCKNNCAVCSNFTYCTSCQTGFLLFREDYDCLDCELYMYNCTQCSYRSGLVVCDACQDGYKLEFNQCNVHLCPLGCASDCHNNGTCIGGCKDGYAGDRCDMICNFPCKSCDQFDKNKCITLTDSTNYCKITFNSNCLILNGSETCNMAGFCLNGCLNGFWDISCNRSCIGGCDGKCDRMTGECYKCERMRYGKFCDKNCSENCLNNDKLNDICTKDLGTCLHGCKPGFEGPYCTQPTPIPTQELTIALRQGTERGWFTYTDLMVLSQGLKIMNWNDLITELSTVFSATSLAYLAGILTLVGSTMLGTATSSAMIRAGSTVLPLGFKLLPMPTLTSDLSSEITVPAAIVSKPLVHMDRLIVSNSKQSINSDQEKEVHQAFRKGSQLDAQEPTDDLVSSSDDLDPDESKETHAKDHNGLLNGFLSPFLALLTLKDTLFQFASGANLFNGNDPASNSSDLDSLDTTLNSEVEDRREFCSSGPCLVDSWPYCWNTTGESTWSSYKMSELWSEENPQGHGRLHSPQGHVFVKEKRQCNGCHRGENDAGLQADWLKVSRLTYCCCKVGQTDRLWQNSLYRQAIEDINLRFATQSVFPIFVTT